MTATAAKLADVMWVLGLLRDARRGDMDADDEVSRIEFGSLYGSRVVAAARDTLKKNEETKK